MQKNNTNNLPAASTVDFVEGLPRYLKQADINDGDNSTYPAAYMAQIFIII